MVKDEKLSAAVLAAAKAIDGKFGQDIKVLDISEISTLSDYFIIATAGNPNQLKAVCHEAEKALHQHGIRMLHSEGMSTGGWVLLDFGAVVIHMFGKDERDFYNLERVWGDAVNVDWEQM
ncbi:MAG: ribosome silencing factor [Defluviitaleaceae bacterium]|nr:ribosome silencing factor [Defluviitaleaceae bacterium]MCL2836490.1 ribosome silencing factor [Defluviitaleaceae bacterium]